MLSKGLKRKICFMVAGVSLFGLTAVGCSKTDSESGSDSEKEITLKLATWGEEDYKYMVETNSLAEAYKKDHPNVNIELELIAKTEYNNTMKIRNTAGELPDVFPVRQADLSAYGDTMIPLNDLKAVENNEYAKETMINGNVIGIPQAVFNEFVYYNKKIFEEYNIKVPTTWDEFIQVCETIKSGNKYTPLLLGLKDSWVDYPFNEYMPMLEAGDGQIYNKMALEDAPFSAGTPFNTAYNKIQKLYDAKVCGNDALGYGWDQAGAMFVAGEGAMIASGSWYKGSFNEAGGKDEEIGVFLLPTRNTTSDPFYTTASTEFMWGIPKTSKYQEEGKEFLEWFFASDYYVEMMDLLGVKTTVKGVEYKNEFFEQAFEGIDVTPVTVFYDEAYNNIMNAMRFDVKAIGQQMAAGTSFDSMVDDLNAQWKKAREANQ